MRLWSIVVAISTVACSGEDAPEKTASPVDPPPAACLPPSRVTSSGACVEPGVQDDGCPAGTWRRDDGTCAPAGVPEDGCAAGFEWASDGCLPILPSRKCGDGEIAVPGDVECRAVDSCGAGRWGDLPVDGDTIFVDGAYAGMDSDGTEAKPFSTIGEAIAVAPDGALVAVAAGTYTEDVSIESGAIRLFGVCSSLVTIVPTGASYAAVRIRPAGDGTHVRGVGVTGPAGGFWIQDVGNVVVERVWVRDTEGRGLEISSAVADAAATVRESLFERASDIGLFVGASSLVVERSVVRDTTPIEPVASGRGVIAQREGDPSKIELLDSIVEGSVEVGVGLAGSEATIVGSVVRDTSTRADGFFGRGINVQMSGGVPSVLTLSQSVVLGSHDMGITLLASEAHVDASVVRGTQPIDSGTFGRGIGVQAMGDELSKLTMESSVIEQSFEGGIIAGGADVVLRGVLVRDTGLEPATQDWGHGVACDEHPDVGAPCSLTMHGCRVEGSHSVGVNVSGASGILEGVVVAGTGTTGEGKLGRGVNVQLGTKTQRDASLSMVGSIVEDNHEVGVLLLGNNGTVVGTIIRRNLPLPNDRFGRGAGVQQVPGKRPVATFQSCLVEDNHETGIVVQGADVTVDACKVIGTRADSMGRFGDGVLATVDVGTGNLTVTNSRIENNARAAVSNYGSVVAIGSSELVCQPFDLAGEVELGSDYTFTDLGGTKCGCPEPNASCVVLSANLAPPSHLEE